MQIHLFRQGLQNQTKIMLDETAGGSLMLKTLFDAKKIIDQMALNDCKSSHNRNPSQRKAGILELETDDAVLAQNKLLTQQLEAMQKEMKALPKQIKDQLQREGGFPQVNSCELCFGNHPTGYCPPLFEEEVNFVGNEQRSNQYQGQQSGPSNQGQFSRNQGRYPSNNNYQRGNNPLFNQYGQPWRPPHAGPSQPYNHYYEFPPQQNQNQSTDETLNQFMQMSMANQKNTDASIKNLETQFGQMAQQLAQATQQASWSLLVISCINWVESGMQSINGKITTNDCFPLDNLQNKSPKCLF